MMKLFSLIQYLITVSTAAFNYTFVISDVWTNHINKLSSKLFYSIFKPWLVYILSKTPEKCLKVQKMGWKLINSFRLNMTALSRMQSLQLFLYRYTVEVLKVSWIKLYKLTVAYIIVSKFQKRNQVLGYQTKVSVKWK